MSCEDSGAGPRWSCLADEIFMDDSCLRAPLYLIEKNKNGGKWRRGKAFSLQNLIS